ncbi:MAG: hypothetical protein ACM3MK_02360 [Chitinophagales bacterium]
MKVLYLALFSLKEYFRSCGLLFEIIMTAVTICLFIDHYSKLGAKDVYFAVGLFAVAISTLTTYRLTQREANAHIYMVLIRSISRWEYLLGKILAIFIPCAVFSFILFLLGFRFTSMAAELSFNEALLRLIPILMILVLCESILLLFTPLVLGRKAYIAGLVLVCFLALGHTQATPVLPPVQSLIKTSYAPVMNLKTSLVPWGFYTIIFFGISWLVFSKRELDYEPM